MQYYLDILLERSAKPWTLCVLGLVLALAALDYLLLYRPQSGNIALVQAELEMDRLEQVRLRRQADRLPQLHEELAALRRALRARLPRAAGRADPLESVTARASAAGLEMTRFQPGAAVAGEFFTEVPLEVEFTGTYHQLLRFLDAAEPGALPDIRDLGIAALPASSGATPLRITMESVTLRFHSPGPGDAAVGAVDITSPEEFAGRLPAPSAGDEAAETPRRSIQHPYFQRRDTGGEDEGAPETPHEVDGGLLPTEPLSPLDGVDAAPLSRDPFEPYRTPPAEEEEPSPEPDAASDPLPEPIPQPRFHAAGIVWGTHAAAALLRDADGSAYVVRPGSRLGGDSTRVTAITPCEIVLESPGPDRQPQETRLPVRHCDAPR